MDADPGFHGRFEELLGLEVVELGEDRVRGRVRVRQQLTDAGGQIHGGVFAAIAHDLVGRAAEGRRATVLSNQTSHLRPVFEGEIRAVAGRRHRGRSTWVWEVEMTDDSDELCAFSRVTLALHD
jgi:1,4-dihydroxy-2-naphthoyl-CoA hydrolase